MHLPLIYPVFARPVSVNSYVNWIYRIILSYPRQKSKLVRWFNALGCYYPRGKLVHLYHRPFGKPSMIHMTCKKTLQKIYMKLLLEVYVLLFKVMILIMYALLKFLRCKRPSHKDYSYPFRVTSSLL
jgi:hypothetical protein